MKGRPLYVSPLRYPGGKRKLTPLLTDLIERSGPVDLFVEPFAGGASIALELLETNRVNTIALSDRDELVASFWQVVFSPRASLLAERVATAEVTLDHWRELRSARPRARLDRAFKCLFLNRTSFSGILEAGPIGGKEQKSRYPIDCRFNRESLAQRILALSALRDRVRFVRCQDYLKTVDEVRREHNTNPEGLLWYLDPPFFEKADRLYRYTFNMDSHAALRDLLETLEGRWVLSYDDAPEAHRFYNRNPGFARVDLTYNACIASGKRATAKEIIVSNIIANLRREKQDIPGMGEVLPLRPPPRPRTAKTAPVDAPLSYAAQAG